MALRGPGESRSDVILLAPSVLRGLELQPNFRLRIFSEFGVARPIAEEFVEGGRLLGLPE